MGTSVKVKQKYQVTIPEDIRQKVHLKVGERVEVVARGKEIEHPIRPRFDSKISMTPYPETLRAVYRG